MLILIRNRSVLEIPSQMLMYGPAPQKLMAIQLTRKTIKNIWAARIGTYNV